LLILLAIAIVILAAAAAFGIPLVVPMHGTAYILFVSIVLLLGIAAAIIIIVLHLRAKKQQATDSLEPAAGAAGDLDLMIEEANRKLRASQQGAKSLDAIPLLYILGDAGSAKTTHVMHSGLDPELVAGAVPQGAESLPTAVLNLWFTRQAALVEAGDRDPPESEPAHAPRRPHTRPRLPVGIRHRAGSARSDRLPQR
jgi:type VI secretion system protein ImpL